MGLRHSHFECQQCGYQTPRWLGRCPDCGTWGSLTEVVQAPPRTSERGQAAAPSTGPPPVPLTEVPGIAHRLAPTGIGELDRVLGGGLVPGAVILIGGDPGIGKSTLVLQAAGALARRQLKVLYVSGEESARQIRLRGKRLGASAKDLLILIEVELEGILNRIQEIKPAVAVIDSIQTVYSSVLSSAPGSVGQVREASGRLILLSKKTGIPIFLVGHVTKDGSIAGPKVLEHMVDTVLYFEGDSGHAYRIIRGIKNRFGPTHEIGVFEMRDTGLAEVSNPSAFFLAERPEGAAGSVIVPSMEGSRPILIEVQSLVSPTSFGMPRRTAIGVDHNRVSLLVAVMDKICGIHLSSSDIFLNVAGGVKVDEPAIDLGIVSAMASSFLDRPIAAGTVVFGEIGLTGEIRGISQAGVRIKEAARMGFKRCILPRTLSREALPETRMELIRIGSLRELTEHLF